jgi:hypothetical protein
VVFLKVQDIKSTPYSPELMRKKSVLIIPKKVSKIDHYKNYNTSPLAILSGLFDLFYEANQNDYPFKFKYEAEIINKYQVNIKIGENIKKSLLNSIIKYCDNMLLDYELDIENNEIYFKINCKEIAKSRQ